MADVFTANLSSWSNLEKLELHDWLDESLDVYLARMHAALTTITSSHLKELHYTCRDRLPRTLDSVLATFTRLKDTDALLSQRQFSHLHRIQLDYTISIYMEDIPKPSDASHVESADGSASHSGQSSQVWSIEPMSPDEMHALKHYAEDVIRARILEELKLPEKLAKISLFAYYPQLPLWNFIEYEIFI